MSTRAMLDRADQLPSATKLKSRASEIHTKQRRAVYPINVGLLKVLPSPVAHNLTSHRESLVKLRPHANEV